MKNQNANLDQRIFFCVIGLAFCLLASSAHAAFYVKVANAQRSGVLPQYGPFSTLAEAQAFINRNDPSFRVNMSIVGSADAPAVPSQADIAAQLAAVAAREAAAAKQKLTSEADGLIQQGIDAYNRQDYEAAIQSFQGALEKKPGDSTITNWIQKAKDAIAAKKQRVQAAFNANKQESLSQLRGLAQGGNFDSNTGLKGIGSTDSGLKGLASTDSGLNNAPYYGDSGVVKTLPVNTDPMVVDARDVPSGLPKEINDAIPHTPAGESERKGFEAIQTHDWKAALIWFQDGLKKERSNIHLIKLIDLAESSLKSESQNTNVILPTDDAELNDTLKAHPELQPQIQAAWKSFCETRASEEFFLKATAEASADLKMAENLGVPNDKVDEIVDKDPRLKAQWQDIVESKEKSGSFFDKWFKNQISLARKDFDNTVMQLQSSASQSKLK
jgi:hypothetical protein